MSKKQIKGSEIKKSPKMDTKSLNRIKKDIKRELCGIFENKVRFLRLEEIDKNNVRLYAILTRPDGRKEKVYWILEKDWRTGEWGYLGAGFYYYN